MMDKMSRTIARVLAVSATCFSVPTLAQGTTMGPGQTRAAEANQQDSRKVDFDQIDTNKDGNIDKQEASAVPGLLAAFDKADADRDAKLNKAEFRIAEAQMKRS